MAEFNLRKYDPEPTARRFHGCDDFVRGILGPVGSGKSVACCWEAFTRALEMPPGADGVRRSRWAFIRNSYPELISTTMNTWRDWVPEKLPSGEEFCRIRRTAPIVACIDHAELPDGTKLFLEVHFLALDKEDDVRKLKSLELTGVFMNEASELNEEVLKMATTRVGRYPAKVDFGEFGLDGKPQFEYDADGVVTKCPFWTGLIMDTNPPDDMHWWYRLAEKEKPKNYRFFRQPPAMLPIESEIEQDGAMVKITDWVPNQGQNKAYPPAENIRHHTFGWEYYKNLVTGKDIEWCKVYAMGEYGTLMTGRPVYPEFRHSLHVARSVLEPMRGVPIICGLDYGLNHSAALIQVRPTGQIVLLDELVTENCGSRRFAAEFLNPLVTSEKYRGCQFIYTGDPAGSQRATTDEATCIGILRECGFYVDQASTNNFAARRDAVARFLTMLVDGKPGMLVSPTCEKLIKGFISGYNYRKMRIGGSENRFTLTPDKNIFSHPHDALQYACLKLVGGGGAGIEEDPFDGSRRMTPAGGLGRRSARPVKKHSALGWT